MTNQPPLKFAFGCQARVGKDTACAYLKQRYQGNIIHFSDPLYQILGHAQDVCGFPRSKDVKFLQWIGTEWARAQKDTVWIDLALKKVSDTENSYIGDLRFKNEVAALKNTGFFCVRIMRTDRAIDRNTGHQSEIDLADYPDWDAIIVNDGSVEELYKKLDVLVEMYNTF